MTMVDTAKWRRIAKLKLAKCHSSSKSPNFLLANISRYTVTAYYERNSFSKRALAVHIVYMYTITVKFAYMTPLIAATRL